MNTQKFLQGGGQMGELFRQKDWSTTAVGDPGRWPESLKSAVSISLNSGFPIAIYWGNEFTLLYNDAWSTIPGGKHPWALGRPGPEVWPEIWDGLRIEFENALKQGESVRRPDALLLMQRYGYAEECYFDYTLSPIVAADGSIGGVFNAVIETTYKYINDRRNVVLQRLMLQLNGAHSVDEGLASIKTILDDARYDIPFSLLFTETSGDDRFLELTQVTGISAEKAATVNWPELQSAVTGTPVHINNLSDYLSFPVDFASGDTCVEAFIAPISGGDAKVAGCMVFGLSPRKRLDMDYQRFLTTVALHSGTIVNNGYSFELSGMLEREQALNEELAATNEELASTNEELAATNEELTSTNEELHQSRQSLAELNADLEERVAERTKELADRESRLRYILSDAPIAIAILTGRDLVVENANKKVLEAWGKGPEILGLPLRDAVPELVGQEFLPLLDTVFTTGEAYYGNEVKALLEQSGVVEEVFSNFVYHPIKDEHGQTESIVLAANVVTEQVVARKKVEDAEEMLRFSIEAANVGTFSIDVKTRQFVSSARLKELFGFHADDEVTYDMITAQIPDDYRERTRAAVDEAIRTGNDYAVEHPIMGYHDQKKRWIRALGKLYPDSEGNLSHFSGLVIDITEQKIDEMRKNDFIGMVSHELKTPLTSLTAYVQLLQSKANKTDDTFTIGALDKVNRQVKKMSAMINGFLNVSRLESGKIHLQKHHFKLHELISEMIDEARLTAPNHIITFNCDDELLVNADRDKIGSVVSNLLSNAIKYSSKDTKVDVGCLVQDGMVKITVKDEGIGIKPHDTERLFDRYYRVEGNNNPHISGFGIGLYLCAEIIKRHGGEIGVNSEDGKGSTFYFTIPAE